MRFSRFADLFDALRRQTAIGLVAVALIGLAAGGAMVFAGREQTAAAIWFVATVPVLLALFYEIFTSLRRGDVGLDIVAALSMSAALAFGEPLAGNVVALMYSGGQLLERFAEGRARREMTALLGRVGRTAMRYGAAGLEEVSIETLVPGDRLLIRHGEVLPVDGTTLSGLALLDQSALTGESLPVEKRLGDELLSGSTSVGPAFDLRTDRPAAESTYAGIVRLVEAAQRSRAPIVRLADRYAMAFLALTVAMAGAAWALSGDHLRALAVLVVATPCPLILAVPVAIISGMSRAAKIGVLVKNGGALEALSHVRVAVLDKTGTLTHGKAELSDTRMADGFEADEVLRLAASLDQASAHVVAAALVGAAQRRGIALSEPTQVSETPGTAIEGMVEGRPIVVGGPAFVHQRSGSEAQPALLAGLPDHVVTVAVAIDGSFAGYLIFADPVRTDAAQVIKRLRDAGVERVVLASGDREETALHVGRELGVDRILANLTPEQKIEAVIAERGMGKIMMVGDGVNDAPALAVADVGVAMGARGAAASSEAASVVLLVDELDRLASAVVIARRTRAIALQSVYIGLGLSFAGMVAAALGYLPPVQGALFQEAIDIAVILNALRALAPGREERLPRKAA